jgi:hypothetical protein
MGREREEHLAECKRRAIELLDAGDPMQAVTSMLSDLGKHPITENHPAIPLGVQFMMLPGWLSNTAEVRRFIEGFR